MTFRGWPDTAIAFFEGLEHDNSKPYWLARREVYERDVRAPMEELLAQLRAEFGEARLLRPYRDIRFSADKSPYRTSIGAMLEGGYVQLSAHGLMAGVGAYHLAGGALERYRAAVAGEESGPALAAIVGALRRGRIEVHGTDPLRSAPRGYAKDHPRAELLRYRGIVAMTRWPVAAWLRTPAAAQRVAGLLRAGAPLRLCLAAHVGADAEERSPAPRAARNPRSRRG